MHSDEFMSSESAIMKVKDSEEAKQSERGEDSLNWEAYLPVYVYDVC